MYANNLKWPVHRLEWQGFATAILVMAMLHFSNIAVNASHGAVVSPESSSVPVMGGGGDLVYQVRCWQEGKEIISEANLEWSAQSVRGPMQEWLNFAGSDGRQSQLMVMPVGTAVCQIHGRSRSR
jgi:hypothetical protein